MFGIVFIHHSEDRLLPQNMTAGFIKVGVFLIVENPLNLL